MMIVETSAARYYNVIFRRVLSGGHVIYLLHVYVYDKLSMC